MADADIIVVGAGPVGMLAAILAAKQHLSVILFERTTKRPLNSRAIGITPPSLEIFRLLKLDHTLVSQGIQVKNSKAYSNQRQLGSINFSNLEGIYKFILAIPQNKTESILEKAVKSYKNIKFLRGYEAMRAAKAYRCTIVTGYKKNKEKFHFTADYVLACDGGKSIIRQALGIPFKGNSYKNTFLMGDFKDNTNWENEARLYFTPRGSVESFPLPNKKRRYVLSTPYFIKEGTSNYLETEIPLRCGINVKKVKKFWESGFGVQHFKAKKFYRNQVFLCGDAAHIMSPIGGQNMNTGFADAELAVWLIHHVLRGRTSRQQAVKLYNYTRKRAALTATLRAELMMRIGTSGGQTWSRIRNYFIYFILHSKLLSNLFISVFSMQSIPFCNLKKYKNFFEQELGL